MTDKAAKVRDILNKLKNWHPSNYVMEIYDKLEQAGIINWPVQAAALSYYCIMGIVPFLALCFAIAKSFGLEDALVVAINNYFATFDGQEKIIAELKGFADNFISKINDYKGSIVAFVALGLIFWSGYRILMLLETAFGRVFGYHPSRRVIHRLMDYFTVMVIVPLVLVAGAAVNIYITRQDSGAEWGFLMGIDPGAIISVFVIVSPYLMWWLVLSWAYAYFSRGLVRWPERLLGGLLAGFVFQFFQTFYLKVMFALTNYNAIYSGFAAIPLFLIWLYASWVIVLGGGELTRRLADLFVIKRDFFRLVTPATWESTTKIAAQVMAEVIKNYQAGDGGNCTTFRMLSHSLKVPMPVLGGVINRLMSVGMLMRVSGSGSGPAFLPAKDPSQINDKSLVEALEKGLLEVL